MARSKKEPEKKDARKEPSPKKPGVALAALGKRFEKFGRARNVLEPVMALTTRFVQYDHATRCGGHPIKRTAIVHGRSNEGKTAFALGLLGSFVDGGHLADLVDAERSTPFDWVRKMVGAAADSDRFVARKPSTYEACVNETRDLHRQVRAAREEGDLPAGTSLLTVIDSLGKLNPEDIVAKIARHGAEGEKGSIDGMGGRAAMIKAALNAAWLNELTPLLDDCGTAWLAIVRESQKADATDWEKRAGEDYRLTGGNAVVYDASLRLRVERDAFVIVGEDKRVVGERHRITVKKTKVGGKEDRATVAYFHTSNGTVAPEGFDRPRDVVELALRFGVLALAGHHVRWPSRSSKTAFPSREAAIAGLHHASDDLAELEGEVRARFAQCEPEAASEEVLGVEFASAQGGTS